MQAILYSKSIHSHPQCESSYLGVDYHSPFSQLTQSRPLFYPAGSCSLPWRQQNWVPGAFVGAGARGGQRMKCVCVWGGVVEPLCTWR